VCATYRHALCRRLGRRPPQHNAINLSMAVVAGFVLVTPQLFRHHAPHHALLQSVAMTLTEPTAMRVNELKPTGWHSTIRRIPSDTAARAHAAPQAWLPQRIL